MLRPDPFDFDPFDFLGRLGKILGIEPASGGKGLHSPSPAGIEHRPQLIFHSDRGSEYAGATLSDRLRRLRVRQSMTRGGAPGDNAHAESFFHTLKAELVHGKAFTHEHQLGRDLRKYMRFYNLKRLHSSLDYRSPAQVERDARRLAFRSSRAVSVSRATEARKC